MSEVVKQSTSGAEPSTNDRAPFQYRVALMGVPQTQQLYKMARSVPWTRENLQRLKDLGFNTIQVNIAWGLRPGDEPLNLEDILRLEEPLSLQYPQTVELRCMPGNDAYQQRRKALRERFGAVQGHGVSHDLPLWAPPTMPT